MLGFTSRTNQNYKLMSRIYKTLTIKGQKCVARVTNLPKTEIFKVRN